MNNINDNIIKLFNDAGRTFCDFSLSMFVQASVLIVVLLLIDILIRKRVRATFRYCIWMLVFIKLILPPALSLPTGIGNWFGEYFVVNSADFDRQIQNINPEPAISTESFETKISPQQALDLQSYNRQATPQVTETPEERTVPQIIKPDISNTNSITWQGGIFLVWFVGVLVLSVLLIQRIFFVRGLIAQSEPAKNVLLDTLKECSAQLGIKTNIPMKLSHNASSPAVCGLFNPVILIPTNLLNKISHEKLKAILIHELSHIKRADLFVNCVQTVLQILYFYNPLLWLANSIVRKIREQAVDEMVLVALGAEAKSYTTTLIDVAEMAFSRPALSLRLVGVVESKKALSQRIKHILSRPIPKSAKLGFMGMLVIFVSAFVLLPMAGQEISHKQRLQNLVENWFKNNYLDIRERKTIEWGEPQKNKDGSYSISYKYEAKILNKDKIINNDIFSFTENGEFVSVKKVEGFPINAETSGQFTATLPNGVTVELLGICEHPSEGKQWWRPDGSTLSQTPYYTTGNRTTDEKAGYKYYEFGLKLSPTDASYYWMIPGSGHGSDTGSPLDEKGSQITNLKAYATNLPEEQKSVNVRVGTTSADWQSIVTYKPEDLEETYSVGDYTIAFGIAYMQDNRTLLPVVHNYNRKERLYAIQVIAITKSGQIYISGYSGSGGDHLNSLTYIFNGLSLENIKEFQFQTRPYEWVTFKNVSLDPEVTTNVELIEEESDLTFESYFPDDIEAGKKLDEWWEKKSSMSLDDDSFLDLFRRGIRRCSVKSKENYLMQYIGSNYVWHKRPNNQKALDIIYHASFSDDYKYYAVYSALSVANPKSEKVLKRLADIAIEPHQLGRIIWGVRSSKQEDEFIKLLESLMNSSDLVKRERSEKVIMAVKGELDADALERELNQQQKAERTISEFGNDLPRLKKALLNGTSAERLEAFNFLISNTVSLAHDESFVDALAACTKDSDPEVRSQAVKRLGTYYVLKVSPPNQKVIDVLTELLNDPDRSVRYAAVCYGLSTIPDPDKEFISKMMKTILDDREVNYYGRVIQGLRRNNKEACIEILKEWMDNFEQDNQRAVKAYEIYEDVTEEFLPEEYTQRFAGKKSNAHEGVISGCFKNEPINREQLQKQFIEGLSNGNLLEKVKEFYIFEENGHAGGLFICDNISDRNAIRKALMDNREFSVIGYYHGAIGPTGSGWIDSLENFKNIIHYYKAELTDISLNTNTSTDENILILQQMIDSAEPESTVVIPNGTYTKPVEITKPLILKGQSRNDCIFEITDDKPAIFINTKSKGKVTLENMTIKWQLATSDQSKNPYAVAAKDSVVIIKNCSFEPLGNFKRSPEAVRSIGFSDMTIDTCRFEGFEYTVCFGEGSKGTIQNSLVMNSGHQGISLYEGAVVKIIGNVVTGSKYHGVRSTGGTLDMKDNLIIKNDNRGVYLGNKSANGVIENNVIIGNGSGISGFSQSKVTIENNVMADNGYSGIDMRDSCKLSIRDNIIKGNERGLALFKENGKNNNEIFRNTFWQNKTETQDIDKSKDSILADPLFKDTENGDFSLNSGPALEAKQGLKYSEIFIRLWKIWENRADKNSPFSITIEKISQTQDNNIIPDNPNKTKIILQANVVTIKQPLSVINEFLTKEIGLANPVNSELTEAQKQKFMEWAASIPGTNIASSPRTITYDGQSTKMSITTSTGYELQEKDVNSPDGYKPVNATIKTGFELELVPKIEQTKNNIRLKVDIDNSEPVAGKSVSGIPAMNQQNISTMVVIPLGQYSILSLGGVNDFLKPPFSSPPIPSSPGTSGSNTFLIIKADIQKESNNTDGKVEFRIAPDSVESSKNPSPLKTEEEKKYKEDLQQNGPDAGRARNDEYIWLPVRDDTQLSFLVSDKYNGTMYLLVSNKQSSVILSDGSWNVEKASITKYSDGRFAGISLQLDEKGGEKFFQLTSNNIRKALTAIIDGKVISAPTIQSAVGRAVMITGKFTEEEANSIISIINGSVSD